MEIRIFNVGHGACALVIGDMIAPNTANVALLDCGGDQYGFRPSHYLSNVGRQSIEHLIVSHFDEDHLCDFPNLIALAHQIPIRAVYFNPTMTPEQIWHMKASSGPVEPGVHAFVGMLQGSTPLVPGTSWISWPLHGFHVEMFNNAYPQFADPNNLSVVTFLHHRNVSIVFPGDLETAGWRALLPDPRFRANLGRVNVFVTSHHGRSNGYCDEVFAHCWPDIFITSDTYKQYSTQEQRYDQHARGIVWNGGIGTRSCLTTRQDGHIRITSEVQGGYFVTAPAQL